MDFIIGVIFWVLAALILGSGLMVVLVRDIVHAALWLIASFAGVAALYFLMEAPFIGVVQILVYTGAVAILVLFAIMLTRQHTIEGTRQLFERWWVAAFVAVALFAGIMVPALWTPQLPAQEAGQPTYWPQTDQIAEATASAAAAAPAAQADDADTQAGEGPEAAEDGANETIPIAGAAEIGVAFMADYYLPFWVANLLLIVALIGAVVIAYEERTRRRRILTLAEEAELRRSVAGLGVDRPLQIGGSTPAGGTDARPNERS